jgi:uncharacterized membrane protein YhdT
MVTHAHTQVSSYTHTHVCIHMQAGGVYISHIQVIRYSVCHKHAHVTAQYTCTTTGTVCLHCRCMQMSRCSPHDFTRWLDRACICTPHNICFIQVSRRSVSICLYIHKSQPLYAHFYTAHIPPHKLIGTCMPTQTVAWTQSWASKVHAYTDT